MISSIQTKSSGANGTNFTEDLLDRKGEAQNTSTQEENCQKGENYGKLG